MARCNLLKNKVLLSLVVFISVSYLSLIPVYAESYYVSSSAGNDAADGKSEATAWKTLSRLESVKIQAGDEIFFKSGDRFEGSLTINQQGTEEKPIRIGSYGEGTKPVLDGMGAREVIFLHNPAHITIEGLEIINPQGSYGIRIEAKDAGELKNIILQELDIHDIFLRSGIFEVANTNQYKYFGGMNIFASRGNKPSWFNGLFIRRCHIHDLGTCGIALGSGYPLHEKRRDEGEQAFPHLNVVLEDNIFERINRDGAIFMQCRGAMMQHNTVGLTGQVAVSNGIWYWDCEESVIQFNEGYQCGAPRNNDGGPFSIDYFNSNCTLQYNYTHDNDGPGVMAFGRRKTGQGSVIRGNLSINDCVKNMRGGFAAIALISEISEIIIEDNIVIAGPNTTRLLGHSNWDGMPIQATYRNNLFIGNGHAEVLPSVLPAGEFTNNVFLNVPNLPDELKEQQDIMKYLNREKSIYELIQKAGVR